MAYRTVPQREKTVDCSLEPGSVCLRVVDTHKPGQWQEDPGALHRNAVGGWDPGMRVTLHQGSDAGLRPLKKQLESRRVRVRPQQNRPVIGLVVRGEVWCSLPTVQRVN